MMEGRSHVRSRKTVYKHNLDNDGDDEGMWIEYKQDGMAGMK